MLRLTSASSRHTPLAPRAAEARDVSWYIMKTLFIDESGYTGYDLLNKQQPFQGASSINIDEKTAKALIKYCFPRNKANELKHSKLSRRKSNWKPLLDMQQILLKEYMGFSYVCDKKYLLILMFLDICIEPFFYDQGLNFYEDGQNYSLASLLYYTAPTFWGEENFLELLYIFQHATKTKSDVAINILIEKAKALTGNELYEYLLPLCIRYHSCIEEIKNPSSNTDAAFVELFSLISHIEKYVNQEYRIIHDKSENLNKYNELLNMFITTDSHTEFKQTEITTLRFPLKLVEVTQVDSRRSYGVQLADILIGGIIEYTMAQAGVIKKNDYNQEVIGLYGDKNIIHMLPSSDFERDKRFRSGTQAHEFIDFIAKNLS